MSSPDNDNLISALPEETKLRLQKLARQLNRSEQEVGEGLIKSFLDLIENPESTELTGLAKEAREKLHPRKPYAD